MYHWIITLRIENRNGSRTTTMSGRVRGDSGSRETEYRGILRTALRKMDVHESTPVNVLFFSLEPDAL